MAAHASASVIAPDIATVDMRVAATGNLALDMGAVNVAAVAIGMIVVDITEFVSRPTSWWSR